MTGPVYRLVVTVITAVVTYINATTGTNLPANAVVTAVLGLIGLGLVLADAHAENGKGQKPEDLVQQIVDALPSILAGVTGKSGDATATTTATTNATTTATTSGTTTAGTDGTKTGGS